MRALMVHCWQGAPQVGWYPWAASTLRAQGFAVSLPALPDADAPCPAAWLRTLTATAGEPGKRLVVIGHSLGALAALQWISRGTATGRISGLLLVAPPLHATGIAEVDRFLAPPPDLSGVRARVERATVLVSDADPYLLPDPQAVARRFAEHGFEVRLAPGRGHFSPASGLTELPELAEWSAGLAAFIRRGNPTWKSSIRDTSVPTGPGAIACCSRPATTP